MKQKLLILTSLMFSLTLLTCNSTPTSTLPPPTSTTTNTPRPNTPLPIVTDTPTAVDPGFNILVVAEGEIQLKRAAWPNYHPTTFGATLERGDLIQLSPGAKASVLCAGLTVWHVPAGAPSGLTNGCPQPSDTILVQSMESTSPTRGRGARDKKIPYIISPRNTRLLSNTPTLRWNDTGASSYTLEIRGGGLNWLPTEIITQPELTYPGKPALQPGVTYLLLVEDDNGKSSQDEDMVGLGFWLLAENKAKPIRTHTKRIFGLNLSDEAKAFAQAQLYAGQNLTAEAIEILESLVDQGSKQAVVHQTLADLYAQIGLILLAEPRYLEAIELAQSQENIETVSDSQANLGNIYTELDLKSEAIEQLTQALSGYETLGDTEQVDRLVILLKELNP